jgi:hypothetical protein
MRDEPLPRTMPTGPRLRFVTERFLESFGTPYEKRLASWVIDVTSNFRNALPKVVRADERLGAISRFVSPWAARRGFEVRKKP